MAFRFLNEGPFLPRTVGKPIPLASWLKFTSLRILATNHCCLLSEEGTSPLMESQQRWTSRTREGDKDMSGAGADFH